jgi:hypothetical protein
LIVHPEAEALVADKLSGFNRLINCTVLSCLSLDLELQDDHLRRKIYANILPQEKPSWKDGALNPIFSVKKTRTSRGVKDSLEV